MGIFLFVFVCLFAAGYLIINMFDNSRTSTKDGVRKKIIISLCQAFILSGIIQVIIQ